MRVLIVGATGRIGSLAVERALAAGHEVVALIRDTARIQPRERLTSVVGDVRDSARVDEAVEGADAVIAAVGPRRNTADQEEALELGMRNIVAAMDAAGVPRLIALSGAGVDVPGDRKPAIDRVASRLVRRFARHVVGAKQREYGIVAASGLEWTALRPPLVTDGEPRGYRLDLRLRPGVRVTRADVGQALVDQLADTSFVRAAPFVLPRVKR
jgi:putative NADH-flavin reductase